jgi:hypothetical protein
VPDLGELIDLVSGIAMGEQGDIHYVRNGTVE